MAKLPAYENVEFTAVQIDPANANVSWQQVQEATNGILTDWGITLLRKGLDPFVKTVLVETPYVCEDYRSLHRNFYGRKFRERSSKCVRLHFFDDRLDQSQMLMEGSAENYIGSSVVEPLVKRCIGRTVLDPAKLGYDAKNVHLLGTTFHNRLGGLRYECRGFPYRTQNDEATVCAHVTMWAVCRYLSTKFQHYRKQLPFDLVEMADRRSGRVIPHHGLTYADYSEMLDRFGCHPVILANHGYGSSPFSMTQPTLSDQAAFVDFLRDLYSYVESGFPVIATFGGHVVSIIGHESQPEEKVHDRISALTGPIHASELVDRYVVMDDNYFPYQFMNRSESEPDGYAWTLKDVRGIVVPLPDEAFLRPQDVDRFTEMLLGTDQMKEMIRKSEVTGPVIYRPFLATGVSLKQFKLKQLIDDPDDLALRYVLVLSLPRFVWCVELSTPELRSKDRAFGEILLDATAGESDLEPIFARIGPYIARSIATEQSWQLDYVDGNPYSTFRQFRHNLGVPPSHV
ncbi:hypothetical protein LOC67_15245 [Stieleria sp. JC731]|uniref:hypothetical protein n=1 Tax=Pirellulaceae TaxID=2691357 RepID=UPI001E321A8E|nr:hypothetical protein [Stieleria sp. JC731]MCC9601915.1 hypothetical protein [Stieleria sp. JC731]